jgi:hypothetical protein
MNISKMNVDQFLALLEQRSKENGQTPQQYCWDAIRCSLEADEANEE